MNVHEKPAKADEIAAELTLEGKSTKFPVRSGTLGPDVIDIGKLYARPAASLTIRASPRPPLAPSHITYIDGDAGVLLYRGYPIDQLAEHSSFLEVCYLLLHGELPTKGQFDGFDTPSRTTPMLHEQLTRFFDGFRRDAHPMAVMVGTVGALAAFYHDSTDINDPGQRGGGQPSHDREDADDRRRALTSIRSASRSSIRATISIITSNFLQMCFAVPGEPITSSNPVLARALDLFFILHADHEQNASTSTVRLAGSSGANPFACIAAGIACLWGPAHGGANEAALEHADRDRQRR